mgnify:CR=1 FL=1
MGGRGCIRGMRVTISLILNLVANGMTAQQIIADFKTEQARGNFEIARFYEKKKHWDGAMVYYNEVLIKDPNSSYAAEAKQRIETIRSRHAGKADAN